MFSFTQNRNYRGGGNAFPAQLALYMSSACSVNSGWTIIPLQFGCLISKAVWKNAYYLWIKNWEEHSFGITNYPFKHARLKKKLKSKSSNGALCFPFTQTNLSGILYMCEKNVCHSTFTIVHYNLWPNTHCKADCWLILTPIMNT